MTPLSNNTVRFVQLHEQVKALRQSTRGTFVSQGVIKLSSRELMNQRLQHLKMFSRGNSEEQLCDVAALKTLGLRDTIKSLFPELGKRALQHHEIFELVLELDSSIELGEWRLRESVHEVIVYASYGSVFPGLRFKKSGDAYHCAGFNFDIRLSE
ncbi:hypothetical protein [Vibrio parahaemolyticus]|jgi:hypothetical protein|uniref:hypothetical protein n=1 Tax=Vibrio parahaemolyticus TaxID=670 RepID=UPI00215C0C50|nr:hypothetical protein [Vibrio parahaemolyticus]MCR9819796.1 hypothetical protein [Vibrio parahaemolyticus]